MDDDDEVMETMRQVDQALGGGGPQTSASITAPNPCEAYDKIRDILPDLIKIAKKIPVVGKRLAKALELLKTLGDQFCPA
ncbi:MAG TPA: hypothetical protein VIT45_07085 [Allosphingosinicella sp.]